MLEIYQVYRPLDTELTRFIISLSVNGVFCL